MPPQEVLVDPILLCLPNPCYSADELESFAKALLAWNRIVGRNNAHVLISESAQIALNKASEYPHMHRLGQLIDKYDFELANAITLNKIVQAILDKTPSLEEYYNIRAVMCSDGSVACDPQEVTSRLTGECGDVFQDDLVIACLADAVRVPDEEITVFCVISRDPFCEPPPKSVKLSANVELAERHSEDGPWDMTLPLSFKKAFPIHFDSNELVDELDLWSLWDNASNAEKVYECIDEKVERLRMSGVKSAVISDFRLGPDFLQSLRDWGASTRSDYAMVTVESCARIILGIPKNEIKEFRQSENSNKQRSRADGALAFRTHITKAGVGLRLMFWRLPDGTIEFANIGAKHELEIL